MTDTPRLHPNVVLPSPEAFTRPPLTQRVAQFWFAISQADFDDALPGWLDARIAEGAFSQKQVAEHWDFRVEMLPGMPPQPKATLTQIPKLTRTGNCPVSLEIAPPKGELGASLKVTQARTDEHPTRFADFQAECARWLSSILDHFGLVAVKRLAVSYRNELTRERYPDQWTSGTSIRLASLIRVYQTMPNPQEANFDGSFLIDFTRILPGEESRSLRFRLSPEHSAKKSPIWVTNLTFASVSSQLAKDGLAIALRELEIGHSYIFEEFCAQFTPVALNLFSK